MPLENLRFNIENLVQTQVDIFMKISDYQTLRRCLIERKPILPICQSVLTEIDANCHQDKELFKKQAIEDAYAFQTQFDHQESQADESAHLQDQLKAERLNSKSITLQEQASSKKIHLDRQQQNIDQLNTQLRLKNIALHEIISELTSVQQQISNLERKMKEVRIQSEAVSVDVEGNTPLLSSNSQTAHLDTIADHAHLEAIRMQEQHLQDKKHAQNRSIKNHEEMISQEMAILTRISSELSHLNAEYGTAHKELTQTLPELAHQRELRANARHHRAQARLYNDPHHAQLSSENRQSLEKKISTTNQQLDQTCFQLKGQANAQSYTQYVSTLESQTSNKNLTIQAEELLILKTIAQSLHRFREMETTSMSMKLQLSKLQLELEHLKSKLSENNKLLETQPITEARFTMLNQLMVDENVGLASDLESFIKTSKRSYIASVIQAAGGAINAGICIGLSLSPLFLITSGAFGVGAATALGVGLYHRSKSSSTQIRIDTNLSEIAGNERKITHTKTVTQNLRQTVIPQQLLLRDQKQGEIADFSSKYEAFKLEMNSFWQKIVSMEVAAPAIFQGFFHKPSAPPSYDAATTTSATLQ